MLKNYSARSSLSSIFTAIEKSLTTHGARQITRDYSNNGKIIAISFVIPTSKGDLAVRLPARTERVKAIFDQQGIRANPDQPYKTSWATIRDWISAQMALIEWDMVKLEEVFLPYFVHKDGRTFFETLEHRGFQLGDGTNE